WGHARRRVLRLGGRADEVGGRAVEAVGEDDVLLGGQHPGRQPIGVVAAEPEDTDELRSHLLATLRRELRWHRREALAVDGRGEDDGPAPVEDVAAAAGGRADLRRLGERLARQPLA